MARWVAEVQVILRRYLCFREDPESSGNVVPEARSSSSLVLETIQ